MGSIKYSVITEERVRHEWAFEIPDDYSDDEIHEVISDVIKNTRKAEPESVPGDYDEAYVTLVQRMRYDRELVRINDL
jgi:hypothetical protein